MEDDVKWGAVDGAGFVAGWGGHWGYLLR
jgi:hypothetical protein